MAEEEKKEATEETPEEIECEFAILIAKQKGGAGLIIIPKLDQSNFQAARPATQMDIVTTCYETITQFQLGMLAEAVKQMFAQAVTGRTKGGIVTPGGMPVPPTVSGKDDIGRK